MLKTVLMSSLAFIACVGLPGHAAQARDVVIDNLKIDAKKVCGIKFAKFDCASSPESIPLNVSPYPMDGGGADWNALEIFDVLGMTYDPTSLSGKGTLRVCSMNGLSAFTKSDLDSAHDEALIQGKYKVVSKEYASANINLASLLASVGIAAPSASLIANMKASFDKRAADTYSLGGSFRRYSLKTSVVQQLEAASPANVKYKTCGDILRANEKRGIITSIAITRLDSAVLSSEVAQKVTADLAVQLKAANSDVNLASFKAGVQSEMESYLEITKGIQYRVIAFDYL